jgi:hypothetical protein
VPALDRGVPALDRDVPALDRDVPALDRDGVFRVLSPPGFVSVRVKMVAWLRPGIVAG